MTEEISTISHLSVAMTTTGTTKLASSPSSGGIEFYIHIALLVIGIVGTATNGLILYALVASKEHKKNVLIVNQNALDFFTSLMMIIVYSLKLCNIYPTGSAGYWLCTLLLSESLVWVGNTGSLINLAGITVDRYLKVVHHTWSKTKLKNWMIYSAMAFAWIGSFGLNMAYMFPTTVVMYGVCMPNTIWESEAAKIFFYIWYFLSFYVIILIIFIFCYWRILVVIRRQAKVMAGHAGGGPSAAQAQTHKMQASVTKTMVFVCVLYVISWSPHYIYSFCFAMDPNGFPFSPGIYYAVTIIAFLYQCTNPFVYAIKFDPVREVLLRLIPCRKNSG